MSVIAVCGLPGSGKSLFTTYLARKHYRRLNRFKFGKHKKNYVYSNYPISLDKGVYSHRISLYDFNTYYKWNAHSCVVLDEIQLYFDSLEFKDFPKVIRNNFQLHRHFGIDNIYIVSQHPSRIVKQLRVLACEFYDVIRMVKIPFTPFAFFRYNIYYNFEDFGKSTKVKKSDVSYKFAKRFAIFNYKKVYKSYSTIYMSSLVQDKKSFNSSMFNERVMSKEDILGTFDITDVSDYKSSRKVVSKQPKTAHSPVEDIPLDENNIFEVYPQKLSGFDNSQNTDVQNMTPDLDIFNEVKPESPREQPTTINVPNLDLEHLFNTFDKKD